MTQLKIEVHQRPGGDLFVVAKLGSAAKPGLLATCEIEDQGTRERTEVAIIANVLNMAQHLADKYGDNYSEGELAEAAHEIWAHVWGQLNEQQQTRH